MKIVQNTKEGEIYRVIGEEIEFIGILISKQYHMGIEDFCYIFYTTENVQEEVYEKQIDCYKDSTLDERVCRLLKQYYQEHERIEKINKTIEKLQIERGKIWNQQEEVAQELILLTGVNKKIEIHDFYDVADMKEESQVQIVAEVVSESVMDTFNTIKETKSCQSLKDKLGKGFDKMWDYIDQKRFN